MDYYEILGVARTASQGEIKNAYRRLVKQYHPDKNPSEQAKTFIQLINEAYETLSDSTKRQHYDQPTVRIVYAEPSYQPPENVEAQRKERFRQWRERERIKYEEQEAYKQYAFKQFKKYNLIVVCWAFLLIAENLFLPNRTTTEEIKAISWSRSGSIHLAKTESFVMAIDRDAIKKGETSGLTIKSSFLLNIPLQVITYDGASYDVYNTVIGVVLPVPILIFLFSISLYLVRQPNNWATLLISVQVLLMLTLLLFWLKSMGDRNSF